MGTKSRYSDQTRFGLDNHKIVVPLMAEAIQFPLLPLSLLFNTHWKLFPWG